MRLYSATLRCEIPEGEVTIFYLAQNDRDFLDLLSWAHKLEEPEKPDPEADTKQWHEYHERAADYHKFVAHAFKNNEFDSEVVDASAQWTSQEVSENEVAFLYRLGIVPKPEPVVTTN